MVHRWQLYRMVTWKMGLAIFSLDEVLEARALLLISWPEGRTKSPNQGTTVRLRLNIYADSKYGFLILHAHAAIQKKQKHS